MLLAYAYMCKGIFFTFYSLLLKPQGNYFFRPKIVKMHKCLPEI